MTEAKIQIDGMSCQHCVMRVNHSIEGLSGIQNLDVTVGQASLTFDESRLKKQDIEAAIVKAGYKIGS
jgi:copper chaperone